jgi:molybdopterin/thiamine biosynthesis adenylyltransferase
VRTERYNRNEGLFGAEGQKRIAATRVAIAGLGGLGSHVAQQLAYLGVVDYGLVDSDIVTDSSLNRLIAAQDRDVAAATSKVSVAERMILAINPPAFVRKVEARLDHPEAEPLIRDADVVFGCVDRDLARLQLTELCARHATTLFDLASDVGGDDDELWYGGRVLLCDGTRCVSCLALLDQEEMTRDAISPEQRQAHERIYGIPRDALQDTGPMVVSINGAVASIAITEFIALVTGLREPIPYLNYYANTQTIRRSLDTPADACYYCTGLWGTATS